MAKKRENAGKLTAKTLKRYVLDNEKQIRFRVIGKQSEKKNLTNLLCLLNRKSGLHLFVQSPRPKRFRYIIELVYIY